MFSVQPLTLMEYVSTGKDGTVVLSLYVQPKASSTRFSGRYDGALKVAVTAPPVEGKANKAVVAFLSSFFQIPKSRVKVIGGLQSRRKRFAISGLSLQEVRSALETEKTDNKQRRKL